MSNDELSNLIFQLRLLYRDIEEPIRGWQGLIAYGCHNIVVIVDPSSMQVLQTLEKHKGYVQKVRWRQENFYHDLAKSYKPCLASADHNGNILVWNITNASILSDLRDGSRPVADMHWICRCDVTDNLLVVLYQQCSLVLYNADNGSKIWKKTYSDTLLAFSVDPFDMSRIGFMGKDFILFIDDFSPNKVPPSNGKRYYMFGTAPAAKSNNRSDNFSSRFSRALLPKKMTSMLVGDNGKKTPEEDQSSELLQLVFHPARKDHLILLYPQEVLVLDLDIQQTVAAITLEKSAALFSQVYPLRQKDGLLCLHENGAVSLRCRSSFQVDMTISSEGGSVQSLDIVYDNQCISESIRQTKHSKIYGFCVCPVSETKFSIITSDGRTLVWQMFATEVKRPLATVKDFLQLSPKHQALPHENKSVNISSHPKFILSGLLAGTPQVPFVIRMCPPLTTKNWNQYKPLLAVGSSSGTVQVYNLSTFSQVKEIMIHSYGIRGIAWTSLQAVITYATSNPGTVSGLVKNEVMHTDVCTGKVTVVRPCKEEESPIEAVKVSYYRQYFIVMVRDKPFEIWDVNSLQLLKQMSPQFTNFTIAEWSPLNSTKPPAKKTASSGNDATANAAQTPSDNINAASFLDGGDLASNDNSVKLDSPEASHSINHGPLLSTREWLVCSTLAGAVVFLGIEGSSVSENSRFTADPNLSTVVAVAMKAEFITMADVEGNINILNIKTRKTGVIQTGRTGIFKIRFAPGRGYMKLLIIAADGADIYDIKDGMQEGTLKLPRDGTKLHDADWAASDRPVLAFRDGVIRVVDMQFVMGSACPIEEATMMEPLVNPYLLSPSVNLLMKQLLCHQPWSNIYKLNFEETAGLADKLGIINTFVEQLEDNLKQHLLLSHQKTIDRCLAVAHLFGDENEITFWTVAFHYLQKETISDQLVQVDTKHSSENEFEQPLDISYDVYCENSIFQQYQVYRAHLLDVRRGSYEHTKQCIEKFILLGQTDRAVQLLLETESSNESFYSDCLKACLAAGAKSSPASQSTVKLAATNLIANGKLMEGTELLCMIGKVPDACRYLQTYGEWYKAAWLAKASLDSNESADVIKRWSDSLSSQEHTKTQAILLLISQRNYSKALEVIYAAGQVERAALFAEVLQDYNILNQDVAGDHKKLLVSISLDYARFLARLSFHQGADYYCRLAGQEGMELRDKINTAFDIVKT